MTYNVLSGMLSPTILYYTILYHTLTKASCSQMVLWLTYTYQLPLDKILVVYYQEFKVFCA